MCDVIVYWVALLTIIAVPAALASWLFIHASVSFLRRLHLTTALVLVFTGTMIVMGGMYMVSGLLLSIRFECFLPFVVGGVILLSISGYLNMLVYNQVDLTMAFGLAEISAERSGKLITTGIYSRVRHPRFLAMALAIVAIAFLTNYLALYILTIFYVIFIYWISIMEENELIHRFGEEYRNYQKDVPRFIPRIIGQ